MRPRDTVTVGIHSDRDGCRWRKKAERSPPRLLGAHPAAPSGVGWSVGLVWLVPRSGRPMLGSWSSVVSRKISFSTQKRQLLTENAAKTTPAPSGGGLRGPPASPRPAHARPRWGTSLCPRYSRARPHTWPLEARERVPKHPPARPERPLPSRGTGPGRAHMHADAAPAVHTRGPHPGRGPVAARPARRPTGACGGPPSNGQRIGRQGGLAARRAGWRARKGRGWGLAGVGARTRTCAMRCARQPPPSGTLTRSGSASSTCRRGRAQRGGRWIGGGARKQTVGSSNTRRFGFEEAI